MSPFSEQVRGDLGHGAHAAELHRALELARQDLERTARAGFAARHCAEERRAARQHAVRAKGAGFEDVDAFVDATRKPDIDKLLSSEFELIKIGAFHSKFKQADVEIDVLYAGASAEDFAVANAREAVILGTALKAASPEALLWLYLVSDREQHFVDALNLLRSNPGLDIVLVRRQLERHQADLLPKLEKMLHTARQPVPSYDESRARRR